MPNGDAMQRSDRTRLAPLISREAYANFVRKFNPSFDKPAAPAESKNGKKTKSPLDIRPPAARNQPKPKFSRQQAGKPPLEKSAIENLMTQDRPKAAAPPAGALNPPTLGIRG